MCLEYVFEVAILFMIIELCLVYMYINVPYFSICVVSPTEFVYFYVFYVFYCPLLCVWACLCVSVCLCVSFSVCVCVCV